MPVSIKTKTRRPKRCGVKSRQPYRAKPVRIAPRLRGLLKQYNVSPARIAAAEAEVAAAKRKRFVDPKIYWRNYFSSYGALGPRKSNLVGDERFWRQAIQRQARQLFPAKKKLRVLICGHADQNTLRVVHNSLKAIGIENAQREIVSLDIHATPLKIEGNYARRYGIKSRQVLGDVRNPPLTVAKGGFDMVVSDAFLFFFGNREKRDVLRAWNGLLNKGGVAITTYPWQAYKAGRQAVWADYMRTIENSKKKKLPVGETLLTRWQQLQFEAMRKIWKPGAHEGLPIQNKAREKQYLKSLGFDLAFVDSSPRTLRVVNEELHGWRWRAAVLRK